MLCVFKGAEREWRFYLADMISFADKVLLYTHELNQASFIAQKLPRQPASLIKTPHTKMILPG